MAHCINNILYDCTHLTAALWAMVEHILAYLLSSKGAGAVVVSTDTLSSDFIAVSKEKFTIPAPTSLFNVFWEALLAGFVAVFTPYIYANIPMTISELTINNKSKENANTNIYLYSAYVLLIFTLFGSLISVIIATTGFNKLGHNWIVNAFFFRIYFGLGLSFLGAFELSLPRKWRVALIQKADLTQRHGMFYKALTLPIVTFSSTFPMIVLVLLFAGRGGIVGSVVGMFAFSLGMITPYIFPTFINLLPITVLNQVKVLLGFLALYLSLKFLSNFALALNFTFLDRDLFIELCIVLALILGLYMMGVIRFNNDFPAMENDFSQQYVSLIQLLIAIVSFTFIVYLIPGLWGASLKALTGYLPPPGK